MCAWLNRMNKCETNLGFIPFIGKCSNRKVFKKILVPSKPIIQREPVMSNKTEYVAHMDGATKVEVFIGDNLETISGTAVSIRYV